MPLCNAASPLPFAASETPAAPGLDGKFRNAVSKPRQGFWQGLGLM